ncbi:RagB/SusD domain-containing protein [Filimonas lacunae]|uniref:RagB/SusD domain-containing protein n=1 Tax=Filimonas lacunae TaxID=477680 RepID=A0A1N7PDT9_9BACT|nr:RagB/SusD family nutrient uptake outer membrane protein [Filimonas lacunae]SIT08728.1 RagB/SusD domain-containing protein [Filimonas lacunae]
MRKIYIAGAFLLAAAFTSCSKSFLEKSPTDGVVLSESITDDVSMYAAVNGMYNDLLSYRVYGRSIPVRGDLMSDNAFMATSNSGRYLNWNKYQIISTDSYVEEVWLYCYAAIKDANNIINATITDDTNTKQLRGEAYAIRALMHFELVRNFAAPYAADTSAAGVPIVLQYDQFAKPARNSIGQVYTQILKDLNKADSLISYKLGNTMTFSTGTTRQLNTSEVSKYAIYALMARVYQFMGDWNNAKTQALKVVSSSSFSLASSTAYSDYWATLTTRTDGLETLFEIAADDNANNGSNSISGIYLTSALGGSYGDVLVNPAVYNLFSTTDARRSLMKTASRTGQSNTTYFSLKYSSYNADYKVIRYSDVLLILAEAYYNGSDITNANLYLNKVAQQRDPSAKAYANSGTQVLEDIINERRKELAFEGNRFYDLYRLQRTFTKPISETAADSIVVKPSTTNLLFPIPKAETDINTNMSQNTGY